MKKQLYSSLICALFSSSFIFAEEDGFRPLFDGKTLQGWASAKSEKEGDWGAFSVNEAEQAIHVYAGCEQGSQQISDCLTTDAEFSHYVLKLDYKWLENRFAPRADWVRDAGLLFHVHGDRRKVWPHCVEMQIGESPGDATNQRFHTGDLFVLGSHIRVELRRGKKFYDPKADYIQLQGRHCETHLGVEKPKGEWNEMEIRISGSEKAVFILNGEIVLELKNMEQEDENGEYSPLSTGRIGLQAEWAELLYRNIRIKEMKAE